MSSYSLFSQQDLTKENLIANKDFIEDASFFLKDRGNYNFNFGDENVNEQIYDAYMEHFRTQNVNEVTATKDLFYAQTATDEQKERFHHLMNTYDNMDSDLGWKAAGDYLEGVFTAPSTYAGIFSFGAGKAGAVVANQGIKLGIREVLKREAKKRLVDKGIKPDAKNIAKEIDILPKSTKLKAAVTAKKEGFIKGGYKTALGSMAVDAPVAGYTVYQQEQTRDALGIQEGVKLENVALGTAFSALGSGTIGSIVGSSKTISSNIAENIRLVAIAKETNTIETAHKIAVKTSTSDKTKDTFKQVKKLLNNVDEKVDYKISVKTEKGKMPLKETVPEILEEGQQLKKVDGGLASDIDFKQGKFVPTIEDKFHDNIASAAAQILENIPPLIKGGKEERITSRLARGLTEGGITDKKIMDILDSHGLSLRQLTALITAEYSEAGQKLGRLGALAKKEKQKLMAELAIADQKLSTIIDVNPKLGGGKDAGDLGVAAKQALEDSEVGITGNARRFFDKYLNLYPSSINKARIGFMTIQTATTARNTTNGYMRNFVYALDNLGEGLANVGYGATSLAGGVFSKKLRDEGNRAVRMGMAQMQTGGQSLRAKDLVLGISSWETEALTLLFRDKRFSDSDLAKTLFREMGDVGENMNVSATDGGIVYLARKANYLNTLSDNMFKRAIFSREMDKWLKTNTNTGGLKNLFKDYYMDEGADQSVGMFQKIFDMDGGKDAIKDAMTTALEFTYQTGKFQGKAGFANKLFDGFISTMSNVLPSTVVPFPRYLVNQFIFQYEHAPIIGLMNVGGILNKRGGEKGIKGISIGLGDEIRVKLDSEAFGKQMGGLGTLAAFYGLRHYFGDESTGPFEFKIMGETYDLTAALGPFMGSAFFADWLYRNTGPKKQGDILGFKLPKIHDNENIAVGIGTKSRDAINAITGGTGKGGTGLWIVDSIVDTLINSKEPGGPSDMKVNEIMARFAGDFFNSALVPAGMLKDIAGTVMGPEYRVVQDTSSVDMMEYMLNRALRTLPKKYDEDRDTPVFNPERNKPLMNVNPFIKMITGFNQLEKKNILQKELARLNFDYRQIAPRKIKGDPVFGNLAKGEMGVNMDAYVLPYVLSEEYNKLPTDRLKKEFLLNKIGEYRTLARVKVLNPKDNDSSELRNRKLKSIFLSLPKSKIENVQDMYKEEYDRSLYDVEKPDQTVGDYAGALKMYLRMYGKDDKDFLPYKKSIE